MSFPAFSYPAVILIIGCASLGLTGCGGGLSNLNPFSKEEARLKGERERVFPEDHRYGPVPDFKQRWEERREAAADCPEGAECPAKTENQ